MALKVVNITQAEGFTGEKKSFVKDPWPDIQASRQNRNTLLQGIVMAIEEHTIRVEEKEKKMPCAVVMKEYVKGIIPLAFSGCAGKEQLRKLMGQIIAFKVIGIEKESNLFIGSRQYALERMSKATWESVKENDTRTAVVREVNLRGVKVDIGGILADLPARYMSWGWVNDVRELVEVGDSFDVKIIVIDREKQRVEVSLRDLLPCPWPDATKRYSKDMEVLGVVTGLPDYGIFVNLEPGVDLLAKQRREEIRPGIGEKVTVVITKIDPQKRHIEGFIKKRFKFR
ncbi:SSU ribosomal protein S1p [Desulfocucumis palustris]|uniref:SSU ribosomal protein S1p n=1 Tax=Desulfocucumis palustris TaxID=1898651 RepID=A0A2L2XJY3_9FIRM|nr:S1 RNA-binding domain-containing protein [Desulfocucumis palustris]GBF34586.1 SSU ribosomal protein S1p [Desulfocucumis palustris]